MDSRLLDYVFGSESRGSTPRERARTSTNEFVRSQDHLSLAKPTATGLMRTALEVFDAYGLETLREVMDYGSAVLPSSEDEPGATLLRQREALGLEVEDVARSTSLLVAQVEDCENNATRSPIRYLERIAAVLGLDERKISVEPGAGGDDGLAARLKTLGSAPRGLSRRSVITLSEAAWVIRTQARLQRLLEINQSLPGEFEPSHNYGSPGYPAWQHGYYLARKARDILGISPEAPIESVRKVCERLGVPLLHASLPAPLAGATVVSSGLRGIVVNTQGYNVNVWVRRATIAHELGHLFWDPESRLKQVTVDEYDEIDTLDRDMPDYVEARANAFAIAFLAPLAEVRKEFLRHNEDSAGLRAVMERFGISYTAAKNHVWNAVDRTIDRESLHVDDSNPTADWQGREAYTDDYFPLAKTSQLRKGLFSGLITRAQMRGLVSIDTACEYLQTTKDEYARSAEEIAGFFPIEST